MSHIIQLIQLADGRKSKDDGRYLIECDVDAHDGRGLITTTDDKGKAKQFPTTVEAWEYWARASKVRPFRPDKQPNRPLTAYTIALTKEE